jgi:hypothetical protein
MPRHVWATDPAQAIQPFEVRTNDPQAGALLFWATTAVDSLHYLDDIDLQYENFGSVVGSHSSSEVDVAHARWATSSCVTALDLCAAAIGRWCCGHRHTRELAVSSFAQTARCMPRRNRLSQPALAWIDGLLSDPHYQTVKAARDALIHSLLNRHFTFNPGGPPVRLRVAVDTVTMPVREIIVFSKTVATIHVEHLLCDLGQI